MVLKTKYWKNVYNAKKKVAIAILILGRKEALLEVTNML